ncbi:MAG: hypothetical protein GEU80_04705 [Dehalococcoidia bacterium]|nr:hypothetical protein [Dehalococcoidia bacterium]
MTFSVSQQAIWPYYFGGLHVGQIRGVSMLVGISVSSLAAPGAGVVRDATGTFVPAWIFAMAALAVATVVVVTLPRPVRPSPGGPAEDAAALSPREQSERVGH